MKSQTVPTYFLNLDGLRFVAFFVVYLTHAFILAYEHFQIENKHLAVLLSFFMNGDSGVSAFYVLSGFLITYLLITELDSRDKIHLGNFYTRRTLRIWPIYFLVIGIVFLVLSLVRSILALDTHHDANPIWYVLFLSNFESIHLVKDHLQGFSPSDVTWSVSVEEQFYVVWPLLFVFVSRRFHSFIFPVILIITVVFRMLHADDHVTLDYHSLAVMGDLAVGGLGAYCAIRYPPVTQIIAQLSNRKRILCYLSGLAWVWFSGYKYYIENDYFYVLYRFGEVLFFAFVILDQNYNHSNFLKFSNSRLMTFWGRYTYGLYMFHALVLYLIEVIMYKMMHVSPSLLYPKIILGLVGFPISLLVGYLSYHYFEMLFLRWKEKFSNVKSTPAMVSE